MEQMTKQSPIRLQRRQIGPPCARRDSRSASKSFAFFADIFLIALIVLDFLNILLAQRSASFLIQRGDDIHYIGKSLRLVQPHALAWYSPIGRDA